MPRRMGAPPPASTIGRPDSLLLWAKRMFCPSEKKRAGKGPHALAPRRIVHRTMPHKRHSMVMPPKVMPRICAKTILNMCGSGTGKRMGMERRDRRKIPRKESAESVAGAVHSCVRRWLRQPPKRRHLKLKRESRAALNRQGGANQSRKASARLMRRLILARTIADCWSPFQRDPDIFVLWTLSRGLYALEKGSAAKAGLAKQRWTEPSVLLAFVPKNWGIESPGVCG